VCNQGTAEKQLSIADVVIPVEKSQKKKKRDPRAELIHKIEIPLSMALRS